MKYNTAKKSFCFNKYALEELISYLTHLYYFLVFKIRYETVNLSYLYLTYMT